MALDSLLRLCEISYGSDHTLFGDSHSYVVILGFCTVFNSAYLPHVSRLVIDQLLDFRIERKG